MKSEVRKFLFEKISSHSRNFSLQECSMTFTLHGSEVNKRGC